MNITDDKDSIFISLDTRFVNITLNGNRYIFSADISAQKKIRSYIAGNLEAIARYTFSTYIEMLISHPNFMVGTTLFELK